MTINMSILILVYVVLGGIGNLRGSIIATVILYALPELLRGFANYRMLIYAIVLIVMMLFNWAPAARNWRARMVEKFKEQQRKRRQLNYGNVRGKSSGYSVRRSSRS